jgi:hypothetical protein
MEYKLPCLEHARSSRVIGPTSPRAIPAYGQPRALRNLPPTGNLAHCAICCPRAFPLSARASTISPTSFSSPLGSLDPRAHGLPAFGQPRASCNLPPTGNLAYRATCCLRAFSPVRWRLWLMITIPMRGHLPTGDPRAHLPYIPFTLTRQTPFTYSSPFSDSICDRTSPPA